MLRRLVFSVIAPSLLLACEPELVYQSQAVEIFPPVAIEKAALFRIDDQAVTPAFFQQQWTLVAFGDEDCANPCRQHLQHLDQARGVRALYVIEGLADARHLRQLAAQYPRVAISMGASAVSLEAFARQFDASYSSRQNGYYLVNPDAELVWQLPAGRLTANDLQSELKLLTN